MTSVESTDVSFRSQIIRPAWRLTPRLQRAIHGGLSNTLQSLCLGIVSRDFHLYTLDHIARLPLILIRRVLDRVAADRGYDLRPASPVQDPDVATIWAYSAILDSPSCLILSLPILPTLHHMSIDHPLCQIPLLSNIHQTAWDFLTTLSLDGIDNLVNDTTIISLRHCAHLTILRTSGCKITDTTVRLLAGALDLPSGRGMCGLRAWFMPGCRGISDGCLRSLARWPGLVAIDLRDTSVTESGLDIFNRYSRLYFAGDNADMQPCTSGLEAIFSSAPGDTLNLLRSTLMPGAKYSALHIVPNSQSSTPSRLPNFHAGGGVWHHVFGTLYGPGAKTIDDIRPFVLPTASTGIKAPIRPKATVFKDDVGDFSPRRSCRNGQSDAGLQLVRMVNSEWEKLVWTDHRADSRSSTIRLKSDRKALGLAQVQVQSLRPIMDETLHAIPNPSPSRKRRRFDAPGPAKSTRKGMKMFAKLS